MLLGVILLGIAVTFLVSKILTSTVLRGISSGFTLELPPYRRPQFGKVIIRSMLDRTVFVLGRAAAAAAPCGLIIWLLGNISAGGESLISICTSAMEPIGRVLGMDGVILLSFILAFPANELLLPIMLMCYTSTGQLTEYGSLSELYALLTANGWTALTALCTMLFSLMHWPCAASCLTVLHETKSVKHTAAAILIPTAVGVIFCLITSGIGHIFR